MAETPDSPSDSVDSDSSDLSLCDEYPCTCVHVWVTSCCQYANAQLAAAMDNLRLHDEAEAQVPNQPANSTSADHGCLDHDTSHVFHTLLVETPKVYLTSACSSCGDKGLFLCDGNLCNSYCKTAGCIYEIPSLCSLDEKSTTSSTTGSSDLPTLESITQIRGDLVEALDRALYINEAAKFQQ